jgi:hypothetical protein
VVGGAQPSTTYNPPADLHDSTEEWIKCSPSFDIEVCLLVLAFLSPAPPLAPLGTWHLISYTVKHILALAITVIYPMMRARWRRGIKAANLFTPISVH